ncbi:MAG: alpha-fucosidase [Eubacterium sp.]|nr:alpha-fucosidase [Eubacterium sp.]
MDDFIIKAAGVLPSERQYVWQQMEFYAFIHFTVNTFTDREWGYGDEAPAIFNPPALNADQWAETCRAAGMKGLILTCKHHDGFCLWPSRFTGHSVKNSPWKDGKGDVVREVSDACRRAGLKFGIYISPWDRHEKTYGDSEAYNRYFINQLTELLTGYGDIFCVWFDGACGEGPNGKRQIYDWEAYYKIIRELQPQAVISVCGPDVRWCGNEAGHCRKSEWSVVPRELQDAEKIAGKSQKADDGEFSKLINSMEQDLGSRAAIKNASELIWYPAEVNTSTRPGWFYHSAEDHSVKTAEQLLKVYLNSVGGNSCFLLNIPPDGRGLIHENDVAVLEKLGGTIKKTFCENLAAKAVATASESLNDAHLPDNILSENKDSFWRPAAGTEAAELVLTLESEKTFNIIVLKENISYSGQHVESFTLEVLQNGCWMRVFEGTVIGYKRICCFNKISASGIRLKITASRLFPTIEYLGVFLSEVELSGM